LQCCKPIEPQTPLSTRGTNFLHQWLTDTLPETVGTDVISVSELTRELFAEARKQGISSAEIGEDSGSVYDVVLDAIVHRDAGKAH
jgi:hypothetical protein